jgi:hypothetical protein
VDRLEVDAHEDEAYHEFLPGVSGVEVVEREPV